MWRAAIQIAINGNVIKVVDRSLICNFYCCCCIGIYGKWIPLEGIRCNLSRFRRSQYSSLRVNLFKFYLRTWWPWCAHQTWQSGRQGGGYIRTHERLRRADTFISTYGEERDNDISSFTMALCTTILYMSLVNICRNQRITKPAHEFESAGLKNTVVNYEHTWVNFRNRTQMGRKINLQHNAKVVEKSFGYNWLSREPLASRPSEPFANREHRLVAAPWWLYCRNGPSQKRFATQLVNTLFSASEVSDAGIVKPGSRHFIILTKNVLCSCEKEQILYLQAECKIRLQTCKMPC